MTTNISRHRRTTRVAWATITTLAAALAMVQLGAAPDVQPRASGTRTR